MMRDRRNNDTLPLPNDGAAYKMSSWWGQATKAGDEDGRNNSSSPSSSTAQSNTSSITSTRTSGRNDIETASYTNHNSNNNNIKSIRHLQREQPSMTPNTHRRTRNKRFVSSTNKTLPAALISIFIASIFTGYNIYHLYFNKTTSSNISIGTDMNHLAVRINNVSSSAFEQPIQSAEEEEVGEVVSDELATDGGNIEEQGDNRIMNSLAVLVTGAGSFEVNGCYLLKGRNGNAWEFELINSITGRTFEMFKVGESGWWNIQERVGNSSPNPPHYGVDGDHDAVLPPVDGWGSVKYSGSWLGMDPMPIVEVINKNTCVSRAESERECLSKCNGLLLTPGRSNHTHFEEVWSACKCAQCQWSYAAIDTLLDQGNLCANDSSHLKDFQVADGWEWYRLSDAFSNSEKNTLQDWKSYYMNGYPTGSLVHQYYQASQEGQEIRFKNYDVLFDVVSKRASAMSSDDFSPTNSVVIHIRLGDVIDKAVDSVRDILFSQRYFQLVGERIPCGRSIEKEKTLVEDWNAYVKPLSYYSEMLDIVSKYSSVVLMGSAHGLDPNHRCWNNTTLTASKSCQYMHGLKTFFERLLPRNISVSLRLGNPPDDDVVFASHAACFIPSGGGYSRMIGNLHSMRGGCSHRYL